MSEKKEWIVMHCLNAFRDKHGNRGEHKIPLTGYDTPMTKPDALNALDKVSREKPNQDYSIRRIADVLSISG